MSSGTDQREITMANIGTAYVQIEPTAKGISGKIAKEFGSVGTSSGTSFLSGFGKVAGGIGKVAVGSLAVAGGIAAGFVKQSVESFSEYEQLAGGVEKIFDDMNNSQIFEDAQNAYKDLGLSANEYLATINDVGATFASTMGDQKGYDAARKGLQAISDYASGTGKDVDVLAEKFMMITRSSSSYQSIADQFSGILPATSAAFLEQAQDAGLLSKEYEKLTEVPIEEYQAAVTEMLGKGVEALNLTGNTAAEATETLSGSMTMLKGAWQNLLTGLSSGADLTPLIDNLFNSLTAVVDNLQPVIERALYGVSDLISKVVPLIAQSLPQLVTDLLPPLLDAATALLTGVVNALPDLIQVLIVALPDIITSVCDALIVALPALINGVIQLVVALVAHLPKIIAALIDALPDILIAVAQALIYNAPILLEALVSLGQTILNAVIQFGSNLITQITPVLQNVLNNIKTWLSQLPQQIAYWLGVLIAKWVEFWVMLLPRTMIILNDIITKIKEFGKNLVEAGQNMVVDFKNRFIEGFNELPQRMLEIGHNIVEGLKNGIKNAWNNLTGWVQDLASNLIQGFKDTLQIGSPSKVFRDDIGVWIPAGIAEGIEDGMSSIDTAMADMTAEMLPDQMSMVSSAAYTPTSGVQTSESQLYGLLARYLPVIAEGNNVNVSLEGNAQGLFNLMRQENKVYKRMSGQSAFA